jgi:hypothetical protein
VTPLGAIDTADATWTISGEGAAAPNRQILRPSLWLFVDSAGYLRVFATVTACCLRSSSVVWMCFVTVKYPPDHQLDMITDLARWGLCGVPLTWHIPTTRQPGTALDGPERASYGSAPGLACSVCPAKLRWIYR